MVTNTQSLEVFAETVYGKINICILAESEGALAVCLDSVQVKYKHRVHDAVYTDNN